MGLHRKSLVTGTIFRHYKNRKLYLFLMVAENPNTGEMVAVYREAPGGRIASTPCHWRPVDEFCEKFEKRL